METTGGAVAFRDLHVYCHSIGSCLYKRLFILYIGSNEDCHPKSICSG